MSVFVVFLLPAAGPGPTAQRARRGCGEFPLFSVNNNNNNNNCCVYVVCLEQHDITLMCVF